MAASRNDGVNWLHLLGNIVNIPAGIIGAGVRSLEANEFGGDTRRRRQYLENLRSQQPDNEFLASLTDDELLGMFEQYGRDRDFGNFWLGNNVDIYGGDQFLADLQRLSEQYVDRPTFDRQAIEAKAAADITADDARARQVAQSEIANLQNMYGGARRDILGAQQEQYKGILGQVGSDIDKARQNALEAGASAGLRLAGNVNVLLSAQNKQRATSLDTANNLAQMLMNQQNQAMGLRRDVAQRDASRAQRTTQNQQQQYGAERNMYNQELDDWNTRWNEATRNVDPGLRDAYSSWSTAND